VWRYFNHISLYITFASATIHFLLVKSGFVKVRVLTTNVFYLFLVLVGEFEKTFMTFAKKNKLIIVDIYLDDFTSNWTVTHSCASYDYSDDAYEGQKYVS
jgi:hypothetical protein